MFTKTWLYAGYAVVLMFVLTSSGTAQSVNCSSEDGHRKYCPVDTRGGVQLVKQRSDATCQQGSTWGYDRGGIWVDRGCRADFIVGGGYGGGFGGGYPGGSYGGGSDQTVNCSSEDGRRKYCPYNTRGGVRLVRQRSDAACQQGSTWGYDRGGIWVDRGCRADFELGGDGYGGGYPGGGYGGGSDQTVNCSSEDGRRKYCPYNTRGGVRLVRQRSDAACQQGSTWGYDRGGIWVDRGCRADFELGSGGYDGGGRPGGGWGNGGGGNDADQFITCSSDDMHRHYCPVDARGGVRLVKQRSDASCRQGYSWGYDRRGIWVDRGCRADFQIIR